MSRFHHNIHFSKRAQGCYIFWAFSSLWIPSCGPCLLDIWHDIEVTQLCPILCDPMDCSLPGSSVRGILLGCRFLLQEIFPTQGSNPGLPHCRQTLYHLSHQGSGQVNWSLITHTTERHIERIVWRGLQIQRLLLATLQRPGAMGDGGQVCRLWGRSQPCHQMYGLGRNHTCWALISSFRAGGS